MTQAKPRIDPDDFASWRDNPLTQTVLKALIKRADEIERQWHEYSWSEGALDPTSIIVKRAEHYHAAEAYRALARVSLDDVLRWSGDSEA